MKNIIKKFLSLLLIVTLFGTSFLPTFGYNSSVKSDAEVRAELEKTHYIRGEMDTPYGKVYFVADKTKYSKYEDRAVWDLVDIAMAGYSWAKLFGDPSWENFGTAIIDTAGLLPLVPSLSTVRNAKEAAEAIAKAYKNDKKVRDAVDTAKKVKYTLDVTKDFIVGKAKISKSVLKDINKGYKGDDLEEIMKKFSDAMRKGQVGGKLENGIKSYNDKNFKFEIKIYGKFGGARILGNKKSDGTFEFTKLIKGH